jgi:hypothetical protein
LDALGTATAKVRADEACLSLGTTLARPPRRGGAAHPHLARTTASALLLAPTRHVCLPPRQDECNEALSALLAWTNHAAAAPLLRDPAAAAPLLRALRGALSAAPRWGSASVPRRAAQLVLKAVHAAEEVAGAAATAAAGTLQTRGGPPAPGVDAAAQEALECELLETAAALLWLAVALPPGVNQLGGGSGGSGVDTTPLYLQTHSLARGALLSVRRCLAGAPARAQALAELMACAVRPPASAAAAAPAAPGTEAASAAAGRGRADGWLAAALQRQIAGAVRSKAKGDGGGKGRRDVAAAAAQQQVTPGKAGAPVLLATTPPHGGDRLRSATPPPVPSPAAGAAGTPGAGTRGGDAPAAAPHAAAVAVSALQTWGVAAQLLGPAMLRDKAAGQALLNVSRSLPGGGQRHPLWVCPQQEIVRPRVCAPCSLRLAPSRLAAPSPCASSRCLSALAIPAPPAHLPSDYLACL